MKYKIGDKVRVREDIETGTTYKGCYFNSLMSTQRGKVVTIEEVDEPFYYIKEVEYVWAEEMFSGLAEEPRNLIPLIAKELGVEIGEEFKISNKPVIYKLTEDGLIGIHSNSIYNYCNTFLELINGTWKIEKLPPKPKLTEAEKVILENLTKEYKYIARDNSGTLYIYDNKPKKDGGNVWFSYNYNYFDLFQHLFQFIKWEDEEPYNIEELLKEN